MIVGYILAAKRDTILEHGVILLTATGLLHLGGFFFGYLSARILGQESRNCQTISIEVGMQNSGLGTALATKPFPTLAMAATLCNECNHTLFDWQRCGIYMGKVKYTNH